MCGDLTLPGKSVRIILLLLIQCSFLRAQVVVNEICTSNNAILQDEDGDYPDWIELYNSGSTAVNLYDYSLTDDPATLRKWIFPSYTLAPSAHLVVFASDKNRRQSVDHWETAIKENDTWKYLVPTSEPSSTWKTPGYNDASWLSGKGGFGYGDNDDSTIIGSPAISVFIRKTFTVTDKTKLSVAALHMDYDDGYVAYLNGYPIASSNMPSNSPSYNTNASSVREATMYTGGMPETRLINYETLMATLVNGTNVLCIQVHNNTAASSDITARAFLSFGISDASVLYSSTPPWFNIASTLPLHTNFKLSGGEPVYLVNSSSTVEDYKVSINTLTNHSFGRKPDGTSTWQIFTSTTPGTTNNGATSVTSYCNDYLSFSVNPGFYTSARTVAITGSSQIRYTLDGSEPNASSTLYTGPITISTTKVLRAACYTGSTVPAKIYTNTYFINAPTSLPVFSISTNPDTLFDPITGIYMLGPDADSANLPHYGANYWEDVDIPVHIEFFETNKSLIIDQGADLRIYGNWSRANAQKSFAIKADKQYGAETFNHKFFYDKHMDNFTQLVLRNSGSDFNILHYRDGFIQRSVSEKTSLDYQSYRPSVVYINGEYWGILNIREKINTEYIKNNHGLDKDSVDIAETWGTQLAGTNNIYVLQWLALNTNMANNSSFKVVADSFDLDNMVDYFSTEIFISNWDWPQNNVKFWRPKNGKRKWRYIVWDTDIGYGLYGLQPVEFNQLGRIKNSTPNTIGPSSDIFVAFLNNTNFRNKFINRYADMMNSHFRTSTLDKLFYDMRDSIAAEIPRHRAKWASWNVWSEEIQKVKDYYTARLSYARNEIKNEFSLTKQVNVTLAVSPAEAGYIKINSISPETYPWTGVYFDGVPVTVTAYTNPGYTFSHWKSSSLITSPNTNKSVTINITSLNETFTAYFTGSSAPLRLTISEINYHSIATADAGDWIELHNYGSTPVDLTGWSIKDHFNSYKFPANTTIPAGKRLVVCSDTIKFKTEFPMVKNFIGPIGFSLDNAGDYIGLYNVNENEYCATTYNDVLPWPTGADGFGYTLELTNNTDNPKEANSWFAGCLGGSPGSPYSADCILLSTEDKNPADKFIRIYPNPAKSYLMIEIEEGSNWKEWKLVNTQGINILQKEIRAEGYSEKIELNNLPAGLYSIIFNSENNTTSKKIIIQ